MFSDSSPCTGLFAQAGALIGTLTCRCRGAVAPKVGGRIVPPRRADSREAQVCSRQAMLPAQLPLPALTGATCQGLRSRSLHATVAAARAKLLISRSMTNRAGQTEALMPSARRDRCHCHQLTLLLLLGLASGSHLAHPVRGRPGSISSSHDAPGCLLGGIRCGLAHQPRARQRVLVRAAARAAPRGPSMRVREGHCRNPDVPAQAGHARSLQASSPAAHMCAQQVRRNSQQPRQSAGCSRHSTGLALLQGL